MNGLPSITYPQPQSQWPLILPFTGQSVHLESTDGFGRGSPIPTASMASPLVPLPPNSLTKAAIEAHLLGFNHNSITSSPSHMAEIAYPLRPEPQRLHTSDLPAPFSDMLLIDDFPQTTITKERDVTILVDYSALTKRLLPKETAIGSSIVPQTPKSVLGSPTYPAPFIIVDVGQSDTIPVILAKIGIEALNQSYLANERELAVEMSDKVQLCVVWIQGDRFGMNVLVDDEVLRNALRLMEKRGWKDNFALMVNNPREKLKDLDVPKDSQELEDPYGKSKGKEKEPSRQSRRFNISSVEEYDLADGGAPL